jgi:hypothetical protein
VKRVAYFVKQIAKGDAAAFDSGEVGQENDKEPDVRPGKIVHGRERAAF